MAASPLGAAVLSDFFGAISSIAEQRIREAQERGEFSNLPGEGKPLPEEDISHVPPELRMAYRVLKNANCLPPELEQRKEIGLLADLLETCPDEKTRLKTMRRLRMILDKLGEGRHMALEAHDEYYQKTLAILERHERKKRGEV